MNYQTIPKISNRTLLVVALILCMASCLKAQTDDVKPLTDEITVQYPSNDSITEIHTGIEHDNESNIDASKDTALFAYLQEVYYHISPSDELYVDDYGYVFDMWEASNNAIEAALLVFLKSKDSLTIDITQKLPFIMYSTSSDGLVKVYTWFDRGNHYYRGHRAIIQYLTPSGYPLAEALSRLYTCPAHDELAVIGESV